MENADKDRHAHIDTEETDGIGIIQVASCPKKRKDLFRKDLECGSKDDTNDDHNCNAQIVSLHDTLIVL